MAIAKRSLSLFLAAATTVLLLQSAATASTLFADGFDGNTSNNIVPAGWTSIKNFTRGTGAATTGSPTSFQTTGVGAGHPFYGHDWPDNSGRFLAASGNGPSPSDIDLWLVSPTVAFNGSAATISFWTFSLSSSTAYLEVRVGKGANATVPDNAGAADNGLASPLTGGVGDFSSLVLSVNPTRATGGYATYTTPDFAPQWTQYTATIPAGLIDGDGRVAFRSWGTNQFGQPTTYKIVALDDVKIDSVTLPEIAWANNVDGNWDTSAAWTIGTAPNDVAANAVFGRNSGAITGARTITSNTPHTVGSLKLDLAAGYTINGTGALTIAQTAGTNLATSPAVTVLQGSHAINTPVTLANDTSFNVVGTSRLALGGTISAAGKTITKTGAGTLAIAPTSFNSLNVDAGKLELTGSGNTIVTSAAIAKDAKLDVGTSSIVIDYAAGNSPLTTVKSAIAAGRITSNALNASRAIGYIDTATATAITSHRGAAVDGSTVIAAATLKGDANLDFTVNFDDLIPLAQNYNATGKEWWNGDFTGDGTVNFDDLIPLAQNYNKSLSGVGSELSAAGASADFVSDWNLAVSLVPEPTTLLSLTAFALVPARRRARSAH